MTLATVALALLCAAPGKPAAPAPVARWQSMLPEVRDAAIEAAAKLPLRERLASLSEGFLFAPYLASPLGEGSGKDPDPTIRYDAVDCLTFVETTMAMALARRPAEIEPLLQTIRYAKDRGYDDRNHLMEAQWLPNNIARGLLRDVTAELAGKAAVVTEKKITAQTWTGKSAVALGLPSARRVEGTFTLPLVPIAQALEVAKKAPTGTIVVVVREDRPYLVTRVSHLGFLIQKKRPTLRHASRTWGRVADEDLETFLSRNLGYAKWTVSGLAFFEVKTSPPAPLAAEPAESAGR